jgi:hypothetical protein
MFTKGNNWLIASMIYVYFDWYKTKERQEISRLIVMTTGKDIISFIVEKNLMKYPFDCLTLCLS